MVLTGAQITAFFENNDQMEIPHETMVQMQHEGLHSVTDHVDFDKDSLQQLADNLRKPGSRIPDCDPNAADRIPSTTPGAEPPRDARDSGSARSHSMHLETSSSD